MKLKYITFCMLGFLSCLTQSTYTASVASTAIEESSNIIVQASRMLSLEKRTNKEIVWTLCLVGGFLVYRWYTNKKIHSLQVELDKKKENDIIEKICKILLKPIIQEQLRQDHTSFNPRVTHPAVDELFEAIYAKFFDSTTEESFPMPSEIAGRVLGSIVQQEHAHTVTSLATVAISTATGETPQIQTLTSVETLKEIKARIKAITRSEEIKRRIESVYPDRCADSSWVVKGIRWTLVSIKDHTVGR